MSVPDDLDALAGLVPEVGAALVIIDPLAAYLSEEVRSHVDASVRPQAMEPLKTLVAEATGAAVLLIRHLNKYAN